MVVRGVLYPNNKRHMEISDYQLNMLAKQLETGNSKEALRYLNSIRFKRKRKAIKKLKAKEASDKRQREWVENKANEFRRDLIKKQTQAEKRFKALLNHLGVDYAFQEIFYFSTTFYIVDFYLKRYNIVIEIDGEYHNTREVKLRDRQRTVNLNS